MPIFFRWGDLLKCLSISDRNFFVKFVDTFLLNDGLNQSFFFLFCVVNSEYFILMFEFKCTIFLAWPELLPLAIVFALHPLPLFSVTICPFCSSCCGCCSCCSSCCGFVSVAYQLPFLLLEDDDEFQNTVSIPWIPGLSKSLKKPFKYAGIIW